MQRVNLRLAISGSAGTGKTTLSQALSRRLDLPLIPEAMRAYLERGGARLDRLPRAEAAAVLRGFREELRAQEIRLGAFVADNGALDLAAYDRWYGCEVASEAATWAERYDAVVLLPAGVLPYERDGVRQEDPAVEIRFQALLERLADASSLKPILLRLPGHLGTPEVRAEWVLSRLTTAGPALRSIAAVPGIVSGPA